MSTHIVPVIEVTEIRNHPNADKLELIPVGGWVCAVTKGQFKVGDLAVYIEPDFMVSVSRPEFAFLKDVSKMDQEYARIKGKRLRGVMSFGLLIPAPPVITLDPYGLAMDVRPVVVGDNLIDHYGIIRWEPPMVQAKGAGGLVLADRFCPPINLPGRFDLENLNNYPDVIDLGREAVIVTEKVHGANARYMFLDGEFYVGSRGRWLKRPDETDKANGAKLDPWHLAFDRCPTLPTFLQQNEGLILYGEIFGNVQDLKYGRPNTVDFTAFAAFNTFTGHWIDTWTLFQAVDAHGIPHVPVLASGYVTREELSALTEQDSFVDRAPPGHMREGVVITPTVERYDDRVGRVSLKLISNRYWERKL